MKDIVEKIATATYWNKKAHEGFVKSLSDFDKDSKSDKRIAKRECKFCFYVRNSRFGGAALTSWTCTGCNEDQLSNSTYTGKLCPNCSDKYSACVNCGGSMNMGLES